MDLGPRFEVKRRLGEGSMGIVFEAIDRVKNERVAVKVLRSLDGDARTRVEHELRALSGIDHPNLVRLHELFAEDDRLFFTMDLVEGKHLIAHVRTDSNEDAEEPTLTSVAGVTSAPARPRERTFDEERLRDVLGQLTRAIGALHDRGLVHRDVKPSNILVTEEGTLRLLDYGLVGESATVAGTAAYMAPEQTTSGAVGPEADFYAMGVVLFEALTGELPFRGLAASVMASKRLFDPPPPRALTKEIPVDLDELCQRLLAREPSMRPTARELALIANYRR